MNKYDIIIVGCGLSGVVLAERYANKLNKRVLILDKRDHVGGNCYDYIDSDSGIRVSKYGPHFFHTNIEKVWSYIQNFSKWTTWEHKVLGKIDDKLFPIPINITTINTLLGANIQNEKEMKEWLIKNTALNYQPRNAKEAAIAEVGEQLYELVYRDYTKKHWGIYPEELDACVTQRVPVRHNYDTRYFTKKYQALPRDGFAKLVEEMLRHPNIKVLLSTDYFQLKNQIQTFEKLFFTGPIDHYYANLQMGPLGYRSLKFESDYFEDTDFYQVNSVINYLNLDYDFTRIVEYKHILNQDSSGTIIFREYGTNEGEPYYPILNEKNRRLFESYRAISEKEANIYFVGRLANFKYINMDEAILNSLELFEKLEGHLPANF